MGTWQVSRYEAAFIRHFEALSKGEALTKTQLPHRSEFQVCHVEHHYVFSYHKENYAPLIIAVFHEKMDLIERLIGRL